MKYCSGCGSSCPEEAHFCPRCGCDLQARGICNQKSGKHKRPGIVVVVILSLLVLAGTIGGIYLWTSGGAPEEQDGSALLSATEPSGEETESQSQTAEAGGEETESQRQTAEAGGEAGTVSSSEEAESEGGSETALDLPQVYYVVNCQTSITLRREASTQAGEYCQIPLGAAVEFVAAAENGFYQVTYQGTTGYALAFYLSPAGEDDTAGQATEGKRMVVVNCQTSITLRKTPSTGGEEICQIPLGAEAEFLGVAENGFYLMKYNGMTGFSLASYLMPVSAEAAEDIGLRVAKDPALYSYADMEADLDILQQAYGDWVTLKTLGVTADGRNLYDIVIGDENAGKRLLIHAGIHAREYITSQLVMKQAAAFLQHLSADDRYGEYSYRDLLDGCVLHLIPMVNPDGISLSQFGLEGIQSEAVRAKIQEIAALDGRSAEGEYLVGWKANANGVDLNRNFDAFWEEYSGAEHPSADHYKGASIGCEVESAALIALTEEQDFARTISYHTQGNVIYWNFLQEGELYHSSLAFAERIAQLTGYVLDAGWENLDAAGYKDWAISKRQIPSITIEVGMDTSPVPAGQFFDIWQRNQYVIEEMILDAGRP